MKISFSGVGGWRLEVRVAGVEFRVSEFMVEGLELEVEGLGLRVNGTLKEGFEHEGSA